MAASREDKKRKRSLPDPQDMVLSLEESLAAWDCIRRAEAAIGRSRKMLEETEVFIRKQRARQEKKS